MALTRTQSVHYYTSSSGGYSYTFEVVIDSSDEISVRNIQTPLGGICDSSTTLPETVLADINAAMELVELLQDETEVDSGTITFDGSTEEAVVIPAGTLNNTNYRVYFTTSDGTVVTAESKTTTGFTATVASAYGSVANPETVTYSVLVKTAQTSDLSGEVTITNADAGEYQVTFTTPLDTANYRVLLEPQGFFQAYVPEATKLKTGFVIELGYVPAAGEDATVGYDVFV